MVNKDKEKLINLFFNNVHGKKYEEDGSKNRLHDGREGHWLEERLGIKPNGNTKPDILGYELKKETKSKTTFGDWSPDEKIWGKKGTIFSLEPTLTVITRDDFLRTFGQPNAKKDGRLSWSGRPAPKIDLFNDFGQKLHIDEFNNIQVIYSYGRDKRENKAHIVDKQFQQNETYTIAQWTASKTEKKLISKFGKNGWLKAHKDNNGYYTHISLGDPLTYEKWIQDIKKGVVFFDPGMYEGNSRPYAQWRSTNSVWDSNAVETVNYDDWLKFYK
ncbi:MAG: LlaMI family restriction endonuclease [Enterovibrio sp.]